MPTINSAPNTGKLHIVLLSEEDIQRLKQPSIDAQLQDLSSAEAMAVQLEEQRHREGITEWEKRCLLSILVHVYQAVLRHKEIAA